ncbi:MAG: tRNA lysidine(34) synthetase TilS [Gammaproteobacteria bacterium]|nr:tRNA lysidine(34) synthetase TilS [Gammaproteobacteria bacterium]
MSSPRSKLAATVAARLAAELATLPECRRLVVAFSGGVDSRVLLDCLVREGPFPPLAILACHVDHGLNPDSAQWAVWCASRAAAHGVAFHAERLPPRAEDGESAEAWARRLRYGVLERISETGDLLLTAHQREDQAETLLLAALRGGGPRGLSGIAPARPLGRGRLVRPLLDVPRADIEAYAEQCGLDWLEDPSNGEAHFDRNFLRHRILPLLRTRWPAADVTLARVAELQREAADELEAIADRELARLVVAPGELDLAALRTHAPPLRRLLLRRFVAAAGRPLPSHEHLAQIERCLVDSGPEAAGPVVWGGVALRRYRDRLHLGAPQAVPAADACWRWTGERLFELPHGTLTTREMCGAGLALRTIAGADVELRLRRGGERCRPAGRAHSQTLKHVLQERGVPPWRRAGLPLVYADGTLVAVADLFVCEGHVARDAEPGLALTWSPRD